MLLTDKLSVHTKNTHIITNYIIAYRYVNIYMYFVAFRGALGKFRRAFRAAFGKMNPQPRPQETFPFPAAPGFPLPPVSRCHSFPRSLPKASRLI